MTVSPVELVVAWALTGAVAATLTGCAIRHGEQPTSPWYTRAQVLTTAVLFAAVAWRFGPRTVLFAPSWLAATGVALLYTVFPGHLGGDLKIAGPIGFLLAWQSWNALLTGTLLTWVLAALALPLSTTASPRTAVPSLPLAPFLIGATLVTALLLPWNPQGGR